MKKLISVLLVAVMMLSVFALTVAAEDEVLTFSICKDADGNPLNAHLVEGKPWTFENGELYLADGKDQGYLIFDNKLNANRVEATIARDTADGKGAGDCGLVFALTDKDGDYNWWEGWDYSTNPATPTYDVGFYCLFVDGGNMIYFARCGTAACYTAETPTAWKPIWSKADQERTPIDAAKYDIKKGITIAAEWDAEGNLKAYINGDLVIETKDPNGGLTGNLYGLRMLNRNREGGRFSNIYFTSYVAGVKSKTETGDATVIVSLIALVAAMGTGIVIGKKRHFN